MIRRGTVTPSAVLHPTFLVAAATAGSVAYGALALTGRTGDALRVAAATGIAALLAGGGRRRLSLAVPAMPAVAWADLGWPPAFQGTDTRGVVAAAQLVAGGQVPLPGSPGVRLLFAVAAVAVGALAVALTRWRGPGVGLVPAVLLVVAAAAAVLDPPILPLAPVAVLAILALGERHARGRMLPGLVTALVVPAVALAAAPVEQRAFGDITGALQRMADGDTGGAVTVDRLVDFVPSRVPREDPVVLEVESDEPVYLRLATLERYDRAQWRGVSDVGLPQEDPPTRTVVQRVRSVRYVDDRLPIASRPVSWSLDPATGRGAPDFQADEATSTIRAKGGERVSPGLRWTAVSAVPAPDREQLRSAPEPTSVLARQPSLQGPMRALLQVPEDVRGYLDKRAKEITRGAAGPYERALRIEQWLRDEYTYDRTTQVDPSNPVKGFLEDSRRGYCEQFASSFALLARSVGLPTRVVVGFAPGDRVAENRSVVRASDAHAWPEVWLPDVGWIPFEPTPAYSTPRREGRPSTETSAQSVSSAAVPAPAVSLSMPAAPPPTVVVALGLVILALSVRPLGGTHRGREWVTDPLEARWRSAVAAVRRRGVRVGAGATPAETERAARDRLGATAETERLAALRTVYERHRWGPPQGPGTPTVR